MVGLASAAGLVGFLSEPDPELRVFALKTLDSQIDLLWTEVVDAVPQMFVIPSIICIELNFHIMIEKVPAKILCR
jgi:26S proteasome regulatory subunit N2